MSRWFAEYRRRRAEEHERRRRHHHEYVSLSLVVAVTVTQS